MKDCTFPRCGCSEREQCRPAPTPSVQPVCAWVMADKDGKFSQFDILSDEENMEHTREWYDEEFLSRAPHRVIRVEIREVNDE